MDSVAQWWVGDAINYKEEDSVVVLTAGLGTGKTHGLCQILLDRVTINYRSKFFGFFEPTYSLIHDVAIPTWYKVLEVVGYREGEDYKVVRGAPYPRIVFPATEQEIHLRSFSRPEGIVGVEYACSAMDEAASGKKQAFDNIRVRNRCPEAVLRQTLVGLSPQGINYAADEWDSDTLPGWHEENKYVSYYADKQYRRYKLRTDDNPFKAKNYIRTLEQTYGHNPALLRSYRYGEFCAFTEGMAYSNYMPQKHDIAGDPEPSPHRDIYLSLDFNANPLAWISVQIESFYDFELDKRRQRAVVYHEANIGATDLWEACVEFTAKHDPDVFGETPIIITGDSTGHHDSHKVKGTDYENIRDYLKKLGFKNIQIKAARSNPLETVSVEAVQKLFYADALVLCKRVRMLRKSLSATVWNKGTRKLDKPQGDDWTHWSDALKYLAHTILVGLLLKGNKKSYGTNA